MQELNYNHLFYFHCVATAGSQAAAARQLQLSQSTISEQIKQLEATLGAPLFERGAGAMQLSDAGRQCLEFTDVMFSTADRLVQTFKVRPARKLHLEIGIASTVGRAFATEFFLPLLEQENVVPRIRHADYSTLMRQLSGHEIDLMLSDSEPRGRLATGLKTRVAAKPEFLVVGAPKIAKDIAAFPSDLKSKRFLHYSEGSSNRQAVDDYFAEHGVVPDIILETGDLDLVLVGVLKGLGFAALPAHLVAQHVADEELVSLGAVDLGARIFVHYVEANPTEHVKAAVDVLTQSLPETS